METCTSGSEGGFWKRSGNVTSPGAYPVTQPKKSHPEFGMTYISVTVKWRGKSAPAAWRQAGLVNPIGSKVVRRG